MVSKIFDEDFELNHECNFTKSISSFLIILNFSDNIQHVCNTFYSYLYIPKQFERSSSFYSGAHSMKQFY